MNTENIQDKVVLRSPSRTELPDEVLLKIVEDLRPIFSLNGPLHHRNRSALLDLHDLAFLRLVNHAWYNCITPLLYSTLFVQCSEAHGMSKRLQAVKYQSHLVETLILDGIPSTTMADEDLIRQYLPACFAACSNLKRLELREPSNILDGIRRNEIRKMFNHFASRPLSSLRMQSDRLWALSGPMEDILKGMDQGINHLEAFEVVVRRGVLSSQVHNFPRKFPSLERLRLDGFEVVNIKKLLSRVYRREKVDIVADNSSCAVITYSPSQITIPLRHLRIADVVDNLPDLKVFLDFLSINDLGLSLTSLHISHLPRNPLAEEHITGIPQLIFKLCPVLQRFMYFVPSTRDWLHQIPSTILRLGAFVNSPMFYQDVTTVITDFEPLMELVSKMEYRRNLKHIFVHYDDIPSLVTQWSDLKSACSEVGLQMDFVNQLT